MGVKGLSKNVIEPKPAWRAGNLSDLQTGTRVGVDAMAIGTEMGNERGDAMDGGMGKDRG